MIKFVFFILFIVLTNYLGIYFLTKINTQIKWVLITLILPFVFAFIYIVVEKIFEIDTKVSASFSILYIQVLYISCCFPLSRKTIICHFLIYLFFLTYSVIVYYIDKIINNSHVIPYYNIIYTFRCLLSILYGILIFFNKDSKTDDEIDYKINWLLRHASLIFIIFDILRVFLILEKDYSDIRKITIASFVSVYIILIKVYFLIKGKNNKEEEYFITFRKENQNNINQLKQIEKTDIIHKIDIYFIETNSYLQLSYNLRDLSEALNIPKREISTALKKLNTNFYNLLAEYRINYAKKIILNNYSYTIESLAHQCGFNSKTTFNFYFKKATGNTPSEYRKMYSKE